MEYFLQGLTMGIAYVAPIGLQNIFLINAAMVNTLRRTLLTALIVLFFDISLALACFWGVGLVLQNYLWLQMLILLVGSLVVLYIGVGLLREKPADISVDKKQLSLAATISAACVVTWFNPQALIDGTMMLGAFRVTLPHFAATSFIGGVCAASTLWFFSLALLVHTFKNRLTQRLLRGLNIVCGLVIIFYGCKLLYKFVCLI